MATPIAPTPPLKGQAAIDFFTQMEKHEKESQQVKERIKKNAEKLLKSMDFKF